MKNGEVWEGQGTVTGEGRQGRPKTCSFPRVTFSLSSTGINFSEKLFPPFTSLCVSLFLSPPSHSLLSNSSFFPPPFFPFAVTAMNETASSSHEPGYFSGTFFKKMMEQDRGEKKMKKPRGTKISVAEPGDRLQNLHFALALSLSLLDRDGIKVSLKDERLRRKNMVFEKVNSCNQILFLWSLLEEQVGDWNLLWLKR